jgi:hypothetical protein
MEQRHGPGWEADLPAEAGGDPRHGLAPEEGDVVGSRRYHQVAKPASSSNISVITPSQPPRRSSRSMVASWQPGACRCSTTSVQVTKS